MVVEWLAMMAVAAVPGTPEPIRPQVGLPSLAGRWFDDDLGYRPDKPHHRTWELTASLRIEDAVITLDHATLDDPDHDRRIDDVGGAIGWTDEHGPAWWAIGAGGRARGTYAGHWIQRNGHQLSGNYYTPTPYEGRVAPVGFAYANLGALVWSRPVGDRLRFGAEATLSGMGVSDAEWLGAAKGRLIASWGPVAVWGGALRNVHDGTSDSIAEQDVLEHEDALFWTGGISAWWFSYAFFYKPHSELSGALSAEFDL